jgi:UDP-N-acetylmuramate dehydrogenase
MGAGVDWAAIAAQMARDTGVRPKRGEAMARYTTMRVGGPADLLAVAGDSGQLAALLSYARQARIPHLVIGRGSNLVVSDGGVRGLVILSRAEGWHLEGNVLVAEAGLPLARAATLAEKAGLSGLEFGIAIPGTVGGAVWANAGAHGSDVASILEWARLLRESGTETIETSASLGLAYRESSLKHPAGRASAAPAGAAQPPAEQAAPPAAPAATPATPAAAGHRPAHPAGARPATQWPPASAVQPAPPGMGDVVLEAAFRLSWSDASTVKARVDEIRRWRAEHQPLSKPSAGSFFRNPEGDSAGRLIDACGLKGARVGAAAISVSHANFIVNDGRATAADVRRLAETVRAEVVRRFGIRLEYEVQFIGDWSNWGQEDR